MTIQRPNINTCQEKIPFTGGRGRFLRGVDAVHSTMMLLKIDGVIMLIDSEANPFNTEKIEQAQASVTSGIQK